MHVRPLHDRILVQRIDEGEQTVGAIIIPDSAKEKPQRGTVIAAGNGRLNDEGVRLALDIKAGDTILFGKYSGHDVKVDGIEYLIMKEDDVLGAIEGGAAKTDAVKAGVVTASAVKTGAAKAAAPKSQPTAAVAGKGR